MAQTPTLVERVVAPVRQVKAAEDRQVDEVTAQSPAPAPVSNVKVVAVTPVKASAAVSKPAAKPAVITVQPVTKPSAAVKVAAVPQKINVIPAKPASVAVVPSALPVVVAAKPAAHTPVAKTEPAKTVVVAAKPVVAVKPVVAAKPVVAGKATVVATPAVAVAKGADPFTNKKKEPAKSLPVVAKAPETPRVGKVVAVNENKPAEPKKSEEKKLTAAERRDPFISPVVRMGPMGAGCSSGKRCLAIDQIALKGVVKSENGMIAVVVNSMDKAYFLRENDPVFNGYVTKITPDSIMFKETFHDKLGKEATRDITKTISRPAA
jgi:Tfp pilus assembly protein PilP